MNRLTSRVDLYEKATALCSPPVVGQTYAVPCYRKRMGVALEVPTGHHYIPVYLPAHEDGELLSFPVWHYHVDLRFLSPKAVHRRYVDSVQVETMMSPEEIRQTLVNSFNLVPTDSGDADYANLWWKPMVCHSSEQRPVSSISQLDHHFRDHRLSCLKCPHKGANLADIAPDKWGFVRCPMHGLKWNVRTKRAAEHYAYKSSLREWVNHVETLMPDELRRHCTAQETHDGAEGAILPWLLREVRPRPSLFPVGFKERYRHLRSQLSRDTVWMGFAIALKHRTTHGDPLFHAYHFWESERVMKRMDACVSRERLLLTRPSNPGNMPQ